jgi:endonuclease/exonuclease/phosphatase family metal-dependent hydrolase
MRWSRPCLCAVSALLLACGDDLLPATGAPARPVTAMSYNLAQIADDSRAAVVADEIAAAQPDFLGVQECVHCDSWLPGELGAWFAVTEPHTGVAIGYDASRWILRDSGILLLGDNDDGWGERVAAWGLFAGSEGNDSIYVYATHWCVTIRSPDDPCTVERQLEYAKSLVAHLDDRSSRQLPVVVAGDFNVFDGFETGEVIAYLTDSGLTDLFRAANPDDDGTTFLGNSWAPSGRLDYLFSTAPVDVLAARIDAVADASDHYPVIATVQYEGP